MSTKYKTQEDRTDAWTQYTDRDQDLVIRAIRKVLRQEMKTGTIHPMNKTVTMKLGVEIEKDFVDFVLQAIQSGKYADFIRQQILGNNL